LVQITKKKLDEEKSGARSREPGTEGRENVLACLLEKEESYACFLACLGRDGRAEQ